MSALPLPNQESCVIMWKARTSDKRKELIISNFCFTITSSHRRASNNGLKPNRCKVRGYSDMMQKNNFNHDNNDVKTK
jgi:hypothetical protein